MSYFELFEASGQAYQDKPDVIRLLPVVGVKAVPPKPG